MTLELRPEITVSPEDIFGRKGTFWREYTGVDKLFRVADSIDEVLPEVKSRGLLLTEVWKSEWIVWRKGQVLEEAELSFFTDRVDEFVWVAETEVDKFNALFGENQSSE